jgi:hypothetical protein
MLAPAAHVRPVPAAVYQPDLVGGVQPDLVAAGQRVRAVVSQLDPAEDFQMVLILGGVFLLLRVTKSLFAAAKTLYRMSPFVEGQGRGNFA